jgi:hypothetical protein
LLLFIKKRHEMIYTNGFIVKGILPVEEKDCIKQHKNYFGIGSYQSWPLRYLDQYMYLDDQIDEESVCSKNGYFFNSNYKEKDFPRSLRIISSNEFVMEYVRLCHKEKIETIIMMVESEIPISVKTNNYSIVESLGWDCIGNDYFSFMFELFENPDLFCNLSVDLNKNLLFANAEQAKKFLLFRENLLAKGENLESAFEPIPARLSVVVFNEMANGLHPPRRGNGIV